MKAATLRGKMLHVHTGWDEIAFVYDRKMGEGNECGRTLMSCAHMRLSNGSDSLNFSMSGSVLPVNRPPHSFLAPASPDPSDACAIVGGQFKGRTLLC